jgi:ketosteroid isomerase-like protein
MNHRTAAESLIRAINYDDFDAIMAAHDPDVSFQSFRGPNLRDSFSVREWHREFLERYADCTYTDPEYIEDGSTVAIRTVVNAKGYDWREFEQNLVDVLEFDEAGLVTKRRIYAQQRDVVLDKAATAALNAAKNAEAGSAPGNRTTVESFYNALLTGQADAAKAVLGEKCGYIDSVYGIVAGADAILDILATIPRPAFGSWRITGTRAGEKSALVELAVDASRPRAADWVRVVDGRIAVIEAYWMLREIGVNPYEEYSHDRHSRRVIQPI